MDKALSSERHPWEPFLPSGTEVLILGSFPPPSNRWCMDFFYPNLQNDFWRIFGMVFEGEKEYFLRDEPAEPGRKPRRVFDRPKIEAFLTRQKIGLYDTAQEVVRRKQNASDAALEVVVPVDLIALLEEVPDCRVLAVTGEKAADTVTTFFAAKCRMQKPQVGEVTEFKLNGRAMRFARFPSSSRAYPLAFEEKVKIYTKVFREVGFLKQKPF